jgi:putative oxidoreductase
MHLPYQRSAGLKAQGAPMTHQTGVNMQRAIRNAIDFLFHPPLDGPRATLLLRLMAGSVFFWEGLLKLVYTNQGVGRFTKLGIPFPVFSAHFVAGLEIGGGLLFLAGLTTRAIAVPFIVEMMVAILSTKISLFLGTSPLPLPPAPPTVGAWAVLHEVRSDWAQILTAMYLFAAGPGPVSLDAWLARRRSAARPRVSAPAVALP